MSGSLSTNPTDFLNKSNAHAHPMYDFLTGFLPRKLKDLFRWTEYLYYRSPHIFRAAQRMGDYAITEVKIHSESERAQARYEEVLFDHIDIIKVLKRSTRDAIVYGNGFYSMYFPTSKSVKCGQCSTQYDLTKLPYEYNYKALTFTVDCPRCGAASAYTHKDVHETPTFLKSRVRVIAWDPKLIDIEYNPISDMSRYYYNIPTSIRTEVTRGNRWFINSLPLGFVEAAAKGQTFMFADGAIYHMKIEAPSGLQGQWGLPKLTPVMRDFFYTGVLRKANEAIAMEYTVPFRVLSPAGGIGAAEYVGMGDWQRNTTKEIRQWRRDNLHIMTSPVPLDVTQMGGQARALLTTAEVQQSEDNIMAGMGVMRELIYGGLSFTGSSVSLRILENEIRNDSKNQVRLLEWVVERIRRHFKWHRVDPSIIPFRLVDDVAQKGLLLQADAAYGILSKTSVAEIFERDPLEEDRRKMTETLRQLKFDRELDQKIKDVEAAAAQQAEAQAQAQQPQGGTGLPPEDPFIAEAQAITDELLAMPYEQRKSYLHTIQEQSQVIYALVIQFLQDAERHATAEARVAVRQQGMAAPE